MTKLLRFRAGELRDAGFRKPFAHRIHDRRRIDQETLRQLEIAVVLQHAGVGHLRHANAVELVETRFFESARDFDRAVAAEVEENHRVAVFDRTDRLAVLANHEGWQILIDRPGKPGAQRLDCRRGAGVLLTAAEDVRLPASVDHRPVGLVAIHRDVHAAATGSDAGREIGAADLRQKSFERQDVVERTGLRNIAPVEQNVHPHRPHTLFPGTLDERAQMVQMAMDVAVGEQTDEMDRAARRLGAGDNLAPGGPLPDRTGGNRVGDQRGALAIHLPGPDRVMTHLRVAHVLVGRHAHGSTMRAQRNV